MPDLSKIELARVRILRFDQAIMDCPDSSDSALAYLSALPAHFRKFLPAYLANVLGVDSSLQRSLPELLSFIQSYQQLYRQVLPHSNFDSLELELTTAFKYLKFYFPSYPPPKVLAFVSPLDAVFSSSFGLTPDILSDSLAGFALLLHAAPWLRTASGQNLLNGVHESYIQRRFHPSTVLPSIMKNIVDDLFPYSSDSRPLLEQLIERGKRYYVLTRLLPHCADTLLFNYTHKQLQGCYANEGFIWQRLKSLGVLYSSDNLVLRSYLGDAPFTSSLSQESPGDIGAFLGLRIVQSYMLRHAQQSLAELMRLPALELFKLAKYKPQNRAPA